MTRIVTAGLLSLLIASTCFGQAKVGTTGAPVLNMVPEARSAGMGGIAVSTGSYSDVYWNPAVLGMSVDDSRCRLSLSPEGASGPYDSPWLNNYSALCPGFGGLLGVESFVLGVGAYAIRLDIDEQIEYLSGPGDRHTFDWRDEIYGLSCGIGHNCDRIQFAAGLATKLVREVDKGTTNGIANDRAYESLAFDFGGIIRRQMGRNRRVPVLGALDINSLVGMSLTNLGRDLKMTGNTYPLPRTVRVGMSLECASAKREGGFPQAWSALLSAEYHKQQAGSREGQVIIGLELQALQTVAFRIGGNPEEAGEKTWGFGVSSVGFGSLIPDHLDLAFDFADFYGARYYQISISYR